MLDSNALTDVSRPEKPAMRAQLDERSVTHWRLAFQDPNLNLAEAGAIARLRRLIDRIDDVADVKVVVFDGAGPEFYLAYGDREPA